MRKLLLIIPVIIFFSLQSFSQAEIIIDCPDSWGPGRFTRVSIRITFSKSDGFARFTQDLPVGFEIMKDEISQGDFNWNGSRLNVVWINIPASGKASFSYFIKPDKQMQGEIDFGGKVVTVIGGTVKETSAAKDRQITIGGSGGILPEEIRKAIPAKIVTNVTNETGRKPVVPNTVSSGTVYRVQVGTSSKEITTDAMKKKLGIISKEKMTIVKSGEIFKYQMGEFADKSAASEFQKELLTKGVKDAFVVTVK
jgi:hypothetical protein